ncbi:tyrosine protein kinase, partial [Acinetobacter baumannii]|nr:tyrosine protein kinase [Acinetobacter baumannii]
MDLSSPALPPNVTPLTDGDPFQVGHYRLIGRLGAGDLSTLYAAVPPDHEAMALKVAGTDQGAGGDQVAHADLVRRAGGVCAVGPRDSGTHEGRPWSAIGYLPGFELRQYLRI